VPPVPVFTQALAGLDTTKHQHPADEPGLVCLASTPNSCSPFEAWMAGLDSAQVAQHASSSSCWQSRRTGRIRAASHLNMHCRTCIHKTPSTGPVGESHQSHLPGWTHPVTCQAGDRLSTAHDAPTPACQQPLAARNRKDPDLQEAAANRPGLAWLLVPDTQLYLSTFQSWHGWMRISFSLCRISFSL
jgi:hypothetical protein